MVSERRAASFEGARLSSRAADPFETIIFLAGVRPGMRRLNWLGYSPQTSRVNQQNPQIAQIISGRTGLNRVAESLEERIRVKAR